MRVQMAAALLFASAAAVPKTFEIAAGVRMPAVLLGTGYAVPEQCGDFSKYNMTCYSEWLSSTVQASVRAWLGAGGRGIDTALCYYDQPFIAAAIKSAMAEFSIQRDEIFVLTKVPGVTNYSAATAWLEADLAQLNTGMEVTTPIDVIISHWCTSNPQHPTPGAECTAEHIAETWRAMEDFQKAGKVRAIGISNFCNANVTELLKTATVTPQLHQIERNPYFLQPGATQYCKDHGIHCQEYTPLGDADQQSGTATWKPLLEDPDVVSIAEARNMSVGQVVLQWAVQEGHSVVPRLGGPGHPAPNPKYVAENVGVYMGEVAELTPADVRRLYSLKQYPKDWPVGICPGEQ